MGLPAPRALRGRTQYLEYLSKLSHKPGWIDRSFVPGTLADFISSSGTADNPILELAKQTKGTTFSPPELATPSLYDELGHRVNEATATKLSELVWGIIGEGFKFSSRYTGSISPENSLMDYFRSVVKEKGLDSSSSKLILQMARMWGDFVGEPIEKQSLKYLWLEECIEGGMFPMAKTVCSSSSLIRKQKTCS